MKQQIKNRACGFTMIEVLVAVVIMSIGFLGIAAVQLTGLRSINAASYRTQASLMADDIVERMRANPAAVDANLFMAVDAATNIDCATVPATYCAEFYDETGGLTAASSCTSSELAAFDLTTWFCGVNYSGALTGGVNSFLPQATATITCIDTDPAAGADTDACTDGSPHTVALSWQELNPTAGVGSATITQTISITMFP